jgi:hypothetical protein
VNEIEIEIVEPEPVQTRSEGRRDTFRPMIGVPQLRGDKDVLTRDPSGKCFLQRLTHFTLVSVSLRTIEVSKSGFQRIARRTDRHGRIRNQSAKPECGHTARSVGERYSLVPKIRRLDHDSAFETVENGVQLTLVRIVSSSLQNAQLAKCT